MQAEPLPVFLGSQVALRPVTPSDYPRLWEWRERGGLQYLTSGNSASDFKSFATWISNRRGTHLFLMVIDEQGQHIGYVVTYGVDLWDGWLYYASYVAQEYRRLLHLAELLPLCAQFLFYRFPLRRLRVEIYEPARRLRDYLVSIGFVDEGFVHDQVRVAEEYLGMWTLALDRATWTSRLPRRPRLTRAGKGTRHSV